MSVSVSHSALRIRSRRSASHPKRSSDRGAGIRCRALIGADRSAYGPTTVGSLPRPLWHAHCVELDCHGMVAVRAKFSNPAVTPAREGRGPPPRGAGMVGFRAACASTLLTRARNSPVWIVPLTSPFA